MALRRSPPLLRAFALAFVAAAASPNSEVATNVLLTAYVESAGARCLDGSPYEIWVARSPSASPHWVIDIMGGAWCGDLASCEARAYAPQGCFLGSSSAACFNADSERCADKAPQMSFSCLPACNGARWCGGLMTNGSATNPLTHDWNKVLLPYKASARARAARACSASTRARFSHLSLFPIPNPALLASSLPAGRRLLRRRQRDRNDDALWPALLPRPPQLPRRG